MEKYSAFEIGITAPDPSYISQPGLEKYTEVSCTLKKGHRVDSYPWHFLRRDLHYLVIHNCAPFNVRMAAYAWARREDLKVRTSVVGTSVTVVVVSDGREIVPTDYTVKEGRIVETPSESTEDFRRRLFVDDRHAELRVYVTLSEAEKKEVVAGRKKIVVPMPQEQTEAPTYKEGEKSAEKNGTEKTENKIVENKNNILPASVEAPEIVTENNSSSEEAI